MITSEEVDEILRGAVDTHVHSGPSTAERSLDHVELMKAVSSAGYHAVVTKDHFYSGVATAALVNAHFGSTETTMYSGVVLNHSVGGLNPHAIEHTARMGGRAVWLPTFDCANHIRWQENEPAHPGGTSSSLPSRPIDVIDSDGRVVDEMRVILDLIAEWDMVLVGGHLGIDEIEVVFAEAVSRGVTRLLVAHPETILGATLGDVAELTVSHGAYIEHSMCAFVRDSTLYQPQLGPAHLKAHIDAAGVERTVLATDLGQAGNLHPVQGMRDAIILCDQLGYDREAIRLMTSSNARALYGI